MVILHLEPGRLFRVRARGQITFVPAGPDLTEGEKERLRGTLEYPHTASRPPEREPEKG